MTCPSCGDADLEPHGGKHVCPDCGYLQPCCDDVGDQRGLPAVSCARNDGHAAHGWMVRCPGHAFDHPGANALAHS